MSKYVALFLFSLFSKAVRFSPHNKSFRLLRFDHGVCSLVNPPPETNLSQGKWH